MSDLLVYDYIYALTLKNDPDTYYYIGRAENPDKRFKEHQRNIHNRFGDMYIALSDLEEQYEDEIVMHIVEEVSEPVHSREHFWIEKALDDGHPLLNSKPGDVDYTVKNTPEAPKREYTPHVLEELTWKSGEPRAKKNETSTDTMGVQLHKTGKRQINTLRFIHPEYGEQEVKTCHLATAAKRESDPKYVSGDVDYYEQLIRMLTPELRRIRHRQRY